MRSPWLPPKIPASLFNLNGFLRLSSAFSVYLYAIVMSFPISLEKERHLSRRLFPVQFPRVEPVAPQTESDVMIANQSQSATRFLTHALAGSAVVLLAAYLGVQLHVNFSTIGFLDLLVVVLVALLSGFWEATVTSLAALTCLNFFFLPPVYTLYVSDPQNWVALITFESTALLVSRLSIQMEKQARTAIQERRGMAKLYELSRRTLLMNPQQSPGAQIVAHIRDVVQVDGVSIFDAARARMDAAGPNTLELELLARDTYLRDADHDDSAVRTWRRVLRPGTKPTGAIVLRGAELNPLMADAIASLTAIALERARSFEKQSHAEAARQSEQLRTAVLDALAHAFKTPLTAIRTASSGLLEAGGLDPAQEDLVTLIDEESDKLTNLSTRLLQTAKLDASETKVRKEPVVIPQLIEEILSEHSLQLGDHPAELSIGNQRCATYGDRELLGTAIMQFIDNAAKYSTPGSPIAIGVDDREGEILISVHNEGSEVRQEDRERIFERFYRSPGSNHRAPGTGLGLSITKEAAEAHQGRTWVQSEKGKGTTFFLSLPRIERRFQ
jgi:two-component system, OmpR family, sensor histidine kinase KdpD